MTNFTEISRRGILTASTAIAAAGAGVSLPSGVVLAQAHGAAKRDEGAASHSAPPRSASAATAATTQHRDAILRISRDVWEAAELSLVEAKSARIHLRELEAAGFRTVSEGTSGYPTAFVSEWSQGTGGPVVAYLPEYDALPALGNAAEPRQTPAKSGNPDGHGCGHNMLGAGCTGGAIALKTMNGIVNSVLRPRCRNNKRTMIVSAPPTKMFCRTSPMADLMYSVSS